MLTLVAFLANILAEMFRSWNRKDNAVAKCILRSWEPEGATWTIILTKYWGDNET